MILLLFLALFSACLILANRDTGMFADAENYSEYFSAVVSGHEVNAEPSFVFIANLVDSAHLDVRGLFFVYLLLGLFLKGSFFLLKMPKHLHISLIYFTGYFVVHDLVQIRIGAALGVALWAVFLLGERKLWASVFLWVIAFALHFSTLLLAIISIFLYFVEINRAGLLIVRRIAFVNMVIVITLLLGVVLLNVSLVSLFASFLGDLTLIPKRYLENYLDSSEVVGFQKIIYSFTLAIVAVYALNRRMLASFVARHAAVCLTFSALILIAFNDMPVIGARLADVLMFFAPLMVFGIYREKRVFGIVLLSWMLFVQLINLFFFSKVIFI